MPYLTIVWVWPPQTSMIVHGRVTVRAIGAASFRAASPIAVFIEVFHERAPSVSSSWFMPSRNSNTRRASVSSMFDQGEADVDQDVIVDHDVGDVLQTDALENPAEIDLAHEHVVLA